MRAQRKSVDISLVEQELPGHAAEGVLLQPAVVRRLAVAVTAGTAASLDRR